MDNEDYIYISKYKKEESEEEEEKQESWNDIKIDDEQEKVDNNFLNVKKEKEEHPLKKKKSTPRKLNFKISDFKDDSEVEEEIDDIKPLFKKKEQKEDEPLLTKNTPTFGKNIFLNKLKSFEKPEDKNKEVLLNELIKSPKESSKKKKYPKRENKSNIKIGNFKIPLPKSNQRKNSDNSALDSNRSLMRERRLLLENITKLKEIRKAKMMAKSNKTSLEDRAEIGKSVIVDEFKLNERLKKEIIEKKKHLEEYGKDRESLTKVLEDKFTILAKMRKKNIKMKNVYEEKLKLWRDGVMKTTNIEPITDILIKRIQEPKKFTTRIQDLEGNRIEIYPKEIIKNEKNFPLFFDKNFTGNTDTKTRWKYTAMKKSAIIFEQENWFKIGLKEAQNDLSLLPTTDTVSLNLTFMSKSDKNLFLKLDYSDSLDFGVIHTSDDLKLDSWSKEEMKVDYKLKNMPYNFPSIKVKVYDLQDKQNVLKNMEISIPLTLNWFRRPVKLKTEYIEKSIKEAQGIFLQSEFYNLDDTVFKSKNEVKYLIREFKEISATKIGYLHKEDQCLLSHGVFFEEGYGFVTIALNNDGVFNINMVTPKNTDKVGVTLINHYLNLLS